MANPNGAVRQRTAEDVAQMESDIAWYREETERLNRELAIALQERNRLQVENALLMGKSMENLAKASRVEAILDNVCNGLVMSLKGIREERHLDREIRPVATTRSGQTFCAGPPSAWHRYRRSGRPLRSTAGSRTWTVGCHRST
jgi:regulator of replication initiation timing